jgi:hypothetical protein
VMASAVGGGRGILRRASRGASLLPRNRLSRFVILNRPPREFEALQEIFLCIET